MYSRLEFEAKLGGIFPESLLPLKILQPNMTNTKKKSIIFLTIDKETGRLYVFCFAYKRDKGGRERERERVCVLGPL